jgi:hypothetical protein
VKTKSLALLLALLLVYVAAPVPSAFSRQETGPWELNSGDLGGGPVSQDAYIIYQNERGETVCREASEAERAQIAERGSGAAPIVIYPGAPQRREMIDGEQILTPSAPDTTGLPLLPSAGLRIVLHGTPQLEQNPTAKNAFIVAANRWEAIISTPITVVIDVDYGTQFFGEDYGSPNILGQAASSRVRGPFPDVRQRLLARASGEREAQLYNALPLAAVPVEQNGVTTNVSTVELNTPLARALGLIPDITNTDALSIGKGDAGIGFNSAFQFDFNPEDGITPNTTDFDSVATHEIGHALAFTSRSGGTASAPLAMWDLFRFRPSTATLATFATAPRIMSKGGEQVFFGNFNSTFATQELGLSTGGPNPPEGDTDDGRQSSHWKADELFAARPYIGIMDPTISGGLRRTITENDVRAIDLLGYTVSFNPVRPENDNFAAAASLQGASGTFAGTNANATREAGEPTHVGYLGDKSVWFNWTSPVNGQATFDTLGSGFDTTLAVYTGATLTQLAGQAQSNNIGGGTRTSRVQFSVVAGTTYRVVVDGWNGENGNVVLNWSSTGTTPTPTPTPTPAPTPVPTPVPSASSVQFVSAAYGAAEHDGVVGLSVSRTGDTSAQQVVTINFADQTASAAGEDYYSASRTIIFAPGETWKTATVELRDDLQAEADETFGATLSTTGGATVGPLATAVVTIRDDDTFPANTVAFAGEQIRSVGEADGQIEFTVTRQGDLSRAASVRFLTEDLIGLSRRDYTYAAGTLRFAPGEFSKTFSVHVNDDTYVDPGEQFRVLLLSPVGTTVASGAGMVVVNIADNDTQAGVTSPIRTTGVFVGQHYVDFLNRRADDGGLAFWSNGINACGADQQCVRAQRVNTSAAFFLSIEFQETGYLVYRFYKAAYGNMPNAPVPVRLEEFVPDTFDISRGVVVGIGDWAKRLESNRAAFASEFVTRGRFRAAFPHDATPEQFVATLNRNTGGLLTAAEVAALTSQLAADNTDRGRAAVLRAVAENQSLRRAELNKAFVLMQYFGYMRRNPNDLPDRDYSGWQFWLDQLNSHGGNFERAEMVRAFIESIEYNQRFAP